MNNHSETESSGHNSVHCDADKIPRWKDDFELAFSAYKGSYTPGRIASRHKTQHFSWRRRPENRRYPERR